MGTGNRPVKGTSGSERRSASGQRESGALRVFISSASGALGPYRKAAVEVCYRLGLIPVHMEEFDPQRPTPAEVCRARVISCGVFVLLLAHRYGQQVPGLEISYTELEYRVAVDRPDMELLPFVVDPDFPWPPREIAHDADADRLARFVSHVKQRHVVRDLGELAVFREDLLLALSRIQGAQSEPVDGATGHGDATAERDEAASASRVPAPPEFHAVPPYVGGAPFTGRSADLTTLDDWGRSADPVMVVEAIGGTGKSALTWQWVQERAPAVVDGLAGRMWWSFYDGSASMTRFLQELLAYTTARPMKQIRRLNRTDLADQALGALRSRPYLLVLDGFERLLAAYHRFDPSKLRDDEVEPDKRSLIEPQAEEIVARLAAAGPSKILISTRLMPTALQGRFGRRLPGVQHLRLPGLTDTDTRVLLARLGVQGSESAIARFFGPLGNHPLLVGIVGGLVRDYRVEPGGFDRWLADPTAGGALHVPDLDLTQRRTHILAAALSDLQPGPRRLLGWISVLAGSVAWTTLDAINPFRPQDPNQSAATLAQAQLDSALKELEERGLLWWDRSSNSYDLHPIIRAYAHEQLEETDRVQANDRVRDHFQALPPEDPTLATSVEDLKQTIVIFRALIGADHVGEASYLWVDFGNVLLFNLGAATTVVELLSSSVDKLPDAMRGDLGSAYSTLGWFDDAVTLTTDLMAEAIKKKSTLNTQTCLINLANCFSRTNALAAAFYCADFYMAIDTATGREADGNLALCRAYLAVYQGRVKDARDLLSEAQRLGSGRPSLWFSENISFYRLYMDEAERRLTHQKLDDANAWSPSWSWRRSMAELRYKLFVQNKQYADALAVAQKYEQFGRDAGQDVPPVRSAFLLAKIGRVNEAAVAVAESIARFPRLHPAARPHFTLARALWELGRAAEAASHAREAYRQAWGDGPPYCRHWDLRDARELLRAMGEPIPDLPVTDPATVRIPLEDELKAFIARLEAEYREDGD